VSQGRLEHVSRSANMLARLHPPPCLPAVPLCPCVSANLKVLLHPPSLPSSFVNALALLPLYVF
jgi:hypothetical protein